MSKNILVFFGAFLCMNLAMAQFNLPPGNYQDSCYGCSVFNGRLDCFCRDQHGFPQHTSIAVKHGFEITNDNGRLVYIRRRHRPWPPRPRPRRRVLRDINAGPIWNQQDAENKCPSICAHADGKWTGQWHTTVYGRKSVCECKLMRYY